MVCDALKMVLMNQVNVAEDFFDDSAWIVFQGFHGIARCSNCIKGHLVYG